MTLFIQISAVIAGGIIALIANYALQMHSFDVQGKTALINQRVAAYSELLLDIATFDSELTPISMAIPSHFYFHAAKAALYGSPIVEAKLQPWITNPNYDYRDHDFGVLIHESKSAMEAEIRAEKAKAKHWVAILEVKIMIMISMKIGILLIIAFISFNINLPLCHEYDNSSSHIFRSKEEG